MKGVIFVALILAFLDCYKKDSAYWKRKTVEVLLEELKE
jgi:hypothetical protein